MCNLFQITKYMRTFLEIIGFLAVPAVPIIASLTLNKNKSKEERKKINWIFWGIGASIGLVAVLSVLKVF